MKWRQVLIIGGVPAVLGSIVIAAGMQPTPGAVVRLPQPTQWVPYESDYVMFTPNGEQRFKRYRAADGSVAVYTQATGSVTIHNVRMGRTFVLRVPDRNEWVSYPIDRDALQPPRTEFLVRESAMRLSGEVVDGLPVYELTGASGSLTLIVPGLNSLPLRAFDPGGRLIAEYSNIRIGPPEDSVFSPPPGASVTVLNEGPRLSVPGPGLKR